MLMGFLKENVAWVLFQTLHSNLSAMMNNAGKGKCEQSINILQWGGASVEAKTSLEFIPKDVIVMMMIVVH